MNSSQDDKKDELYIHVRKIVLTRTNVETNVENYLRIIRNITSYIFELFLYLVGFWVFTLGLIEFTMKITEQIFE